MNKIKIAVIAGIGMTSLAVSAHAQTVTAADGDLLLGFRTTGSPGNTLDLEVDLGSYTNFILMNGATFTLTQLSLLDLSGTYGSSWHTRSDLDWSIAATSYNVGGSIGLPNNTIFETSVNTGGTSTVFKRQTSSLQQAVSQTLDTFVGGLNGAPTTANSNSASLVADSGNSYNTNISNGGSNTRPWGATSASLMTFTNVENTTNIPSGSYVASDLYEMLPTTSGTANAVDLGQFRLYDTGALTFTAVSAVPEPATTSVLLVGLGVIGYVVNRRGRKAKA